MNQQIKSLTINVSFLPTVGSPRYPIGKGTITLDDSSIILKHTSILLFPKTRIIPFKDIDSYFRPSKAIAYLDHHNKHCSKIVRLGNFMYDDTQVRDIEIIIKVLKSHKVKVRGQRHKIFGL